LDPAFKTTDHVSVRFVPVRWQTSGEGFTVKLESGDPGECEHISAGQNNKEGVSPPCTASAQPPALDIRGNPHTFVDTLNIWKSRNIEDIATPAGAPPSAGRGKAMHAAAAVVGFSVLLRFIAILQRSMFRGFPRISRAGGLRGRLGRRRHCGAHLAASLAILPVAA
jgi:hypothetical protein